MLAVALYDVVLWAHIVAVLVAFGGAFTYPVWFAMIRNAGLDQRAFLHRSQALIGQRLIGPASIIILLAGAYLASERDAWGEAWVLVSLVILLALIIGGPLYFGRTETRLAELAERGDQAGYEEAFSGFRPVMYVALVSVLIAAFLMVTKLGG